MDDFDTNRMVEGILARRVEEIQARRAAQRQEPLFTQIDTGTFNNPFHLPPITRSEWRAISMVTTEFLAGPTAKKQLPEPVGVYDGPPIVSDALRDIFSQAQYHGVGGTLLNFADNAAIDEEASPAYDLRPTPTGMISGIPKKKRHTDNPEASRVDYKPARILKQIGRESWFSHISERGWNVMAETYRSLTRELALQYQIVEGEAIAYWYHENQNMANRGNLSASCMRYDYCQPYFELYVKNPRQVQMVVATYPEHTGLCAARALLWQTNIGPFMDRIYSTPATTQAMVRWAHEQGYYTRAENNSPEEPRRLITPAGEERTMTIEVQLDHWPCRHYPYLDTLRYATEEGLLHNGHRRDYRYALQGTRGTGGPMPPGLHQCLCGMHFALGEGEGRLFESTETQTIALCDHCITTNAYAIAPCEICDTEILADYARHLNNGYVCAQCFSQRAATCGHCHHTTLNEDLVTIPTRRDPICRECLQNRQHLLARRPDRGANNGVINRNGNLSTRYTNITCNDCQGDIRGGEPAAYSPNAQWLLCGACLDATPMEEYYG